MFDKKVLSTLFVFAGILLFVYLMRPLIPAFCLALVLIYITNPLVTFLQKYIKRRILAVSASFLLLIMSFVFISFFLLGEVISEVHRLPEYLQTQKAFADLNVFQEISLSELIRNLLTENGIRLLLGILVKLGNVAIQTFFGVLVAFFVVWKDIRIPIKDEKIQQVFDIIDRAIKAVVASLLLTAVVTGLISIPIYYAFDIPYPLLCAALTGFLTLLPLIGAWLLYLPVTAYLFLARSPTDSIIFLVFCAFFISTLPDILVRPIAGKTKEMGAVPLLIGFTTGLMVFGISGIVLGPLIVIAAIAFWKVYLEKPEE